jgi:hypothetical protein
LKIFEVKIFSLPEYNQFATTGTIPVVSYFSLLHSVQTDSGAHPASYPFDKEGFSPGVKRQGREADHSSQSSADVKKSGGIPPVPHMSSWQSA